MKVINGYGENLTTYQYNQYLVKLRDYLVPYIIDNYADSNLDMIFKNEFTRSDILNSTIYYITKNQNVKSMSAIDDFLIALNSLFVNHLFDKYVNQNLMILVPFTGLRNDINQKLISMGINLLEKESNPNIEEDEYRFILDYLDSYSGTRLMSLQLPIIIRLFLLYGFSFDKLASLNIDDYDIERNTLRIENIRDKRNIINLELPFCMRTYFKKLFEFRSNKPELNLSLLFVTEKNNKIEHTAPFNILKKIKESYEENMGIFYDDNLKNPFTSTGLQKYAIINMLLCGMNETTISDLTDQQQDIISSCQLKVSENNKGDLNRYVNHKIRGIKTYDDLK